MCIPLGEAEPKPFGRKKPPRQWGRDGPTLYTNLPSMAQLSNSFAYENASATFMAIINFYGQPQFVCKCHRAQSKPKWKKLAIRLTPKIHGTGYAKLANYLKVGRRKCKRLWLWNICISIACLLCKFLHSELKMFQNFRLLTLR